MQKANVRRLTMNKTIKHGALALSLLAGAALMTAPAMAKHNHGRFGGSWDHRDHYARNYYGPRYAYRGYAYNGPRYYSYYGDPYYYDYGPRVRFGFPGAGIWLGF
jgi:uncharacterized membrane protein